MIRVLVVDDHLLVGDAITDLLAATGDIHLVGHCADSGEVAAAVQRLHPDVVLLDQVDRGEGDDPSLSER